MKTREKLGLVSTFILALIYAFLTSGCGSERRFSAAGPAVTTRPATPSECSTGGTVVVINGVATIVCNGAVGAPGEDGNIGAPGAPGVDATPVTVVTLCPGVSSYPGVFVEIGLCISGKLYGVYSANGGFLTYLPPGNYSSNGIGSACNLTVQSNCVVSH